MDTHADAMERINAKEMRGESVWKGKERVGQDSVEQYNTETNYFMTGAGSICICMYVHTLATSVPLPRKLRALLAVPGGFIIMQ